MKPNRGEQLGAQNLEKLKRYLETHKDSLPLFNGRLNKSRIAKDAGLDRQVFENNPAASALLAQHGEATRLTRLPPVATESEALEKIRRLEAEVSKFRDLAAKQSVELAKRRKAAVECDTKLRVYETMLDTMRKPPMPIRKEESQ